MMRETAAKAIDELLEGGKRYREAWEKYEKDFAEYEKKLAEWEKNEGHRVAAREPARTRARARATAGGAARRFPRDGPRAAGAAAAGVAASAVAEPPPESESSLRARRRPGKPKAPEKPRVEPGKEALVRVHQARGPALDRRALGVRHRRGARPREEEEHPGRAGGRHRGLPAHRRDQGRPRRRRPRRAALDRRRQPRPPDAARRSLRDARPGRRPGDVLHRRRSRDGPGRASRSPPRSRSVAGCPRTQALAAVTSNAARALGVEKKIGTIEADRIASLFACRGSPVRAGRARVPGLDPGQARPMGAELTWPACHLKHRTAAVFALVCASAAWGQAHDGASGSWIVKAKLVVPVEGAPIENGAVRIAGGKIDAIGASVDATGVPGRHVVDFPEGIVYPGLIDAGSWQGIAPRARRPGPPVPAAQPDRRRLRSDERGLRGEPRRWNHDRPPDAGQRERDRRPDARS